MSEINANETVTKVADTMHEAVDKLEATARNVSESVGDTINNFNEQMVEEKINLKSRYDRFVESNNDPSWSNLEMVAGMGIASFVTWGITRFFSK